MNFINSLDGWREACDNNIKITCYYQKNVRMEEGYVGANEVGRRLCALEERMLPFPQCAERSFAC